METDDQWEVVTSGNVIYGLDPAVVAATLRRRFKLDEAAIARVLDGRHKTLKKGLDAKSARKYEAAFSSAGLTATAKRMPSKEKRPPADALTLQLIPADAARHVPSTGHGMPPPTRPKIEPGHMRCPKCNAVQPKAFECRECGIIINRHTASAAAAAAAEPPTADQPGIREPVTKISLAVAASVVIAIAYTFYPGPSRIVASPQAQAQARAVATAMAHNPPTPSRIKSLIETGDYGAAEAIIKDLQDKTLRDISWEDAYFRTVLRISPKNGFTEAQVDRWVAATGSTTAYLARGIYLQSSGQEARGDKLAYQTSSQQFEAQTRLTRRARGDLEKALQRDPQLLPAYFALIWMDTVRGLDTDKKQLLADAIAAAPGTLYVRNAYLETIAPKWGGSYDSMAAFTDVSMRYLDRNPRLWAMQGKPYAEQAEDAWQAHDLEKTVGLYAKALSFGIDRDWLKNSVTILVYLRRNDEAREYLETMLKYFPGDAYAQDMRTKLAR